MGLGVSSRMAYMLDQLERQQMPTLDSMAKDYGMERKSFERTEKMLKKLFPIVKDSEGRLSFEKGFTLKKSPINEYEIALLSLALLYLYDEEGDDSGDEHEKNPSLTDIKAIVIKILMPSQDNPVHVPPHTFEPIDFESDTIKTLHKAIPKLKTIEMVFESQRFVVEPYKVMAIGHLWYLLAYDREEREIKPFRSKKIEQVKELDDPVNLPKNMEEILEDVQSPDYDDDVHFDIIIRVHSKVADYFVDRLAFPTQQNLKAYSDGSYKIKFEVTHVEDVDNMIKSFLPDIEILEPEWYRNQILDELEDYVKRLKSCSC